MTCLKPDTLFPDDGMIGVEVLGSAQRAHAAALPYDQIVCRATAIKSAVDALIEDSGKRAGIAFAVLSDEISNLFQPRPRPRTPGPVNPLGALNPANDNRGRRCDDRINPAPLNVIGLSAFGGSGLHGVRRRKEGARQPV